MEHKINIISYADKPILKLVNKYNETHNLPEKELFKVLKNYNLKNALTYLGFKSSKIFFKKENGLLSNFVIYDELNDIPVTQSGIAYLANAFILSGANDYRKDLITVNDDPNFKALIYIFNNLLESSIPQNIFELVYIVKFQQLYLQTSQKRYISRNYTIYNLISEYNSLKTKSGYLDLNSSFKDLTGITIDEYFKIAFILGSLSILRPFFNISDFEVFINLDRLPSEYIKSLNKEKVISFINLLKSNYKDLKNFEKDFSLYNTNIIGSHRYNLLQDKPIIEFENKRNYCYIIPSIPSYFVRTYNNFYSVFDDYFLDKYRKYFGYLFEEYVGFILKEKYPKSKIIQEIKYNNNNMDFVDWIVDLGDKVYLIEVKASQLKYKIVSMKLVREFIENSAIKAIKQLYRKINDIDKYKELSFLKGKLIIPIVVFFDIPTIARNDSIFSFEAWIKQKISETNTVEKFPINDFKFYLLGIDDLEDFLYAPEGLSLEAILDELHQSTQESFGSIVSKYVNKDEIPYTFINRVFDELYGFYKTIQEKLE